MSPKPNRPTRPIILGIDEVGRGPWAGPLVIGAVILPSPLPDWAEGLTDSKKLTPKKREHLAELILAEAPATALGWVSARELDATGLADSLKLATRRAVQQIRLQNAPFTEIIIDGTVNFLSNTTLSPFVTTLKKADLLIKEVSAASIIAKVARDHYMQELSAIYPGYGFENHVGYGTAAHRAALQDLGPTPEHRTSFKPIQALLPKSPAPLASGPPTASPPSSSANIKSTITSIPQTTASSTRTPNHPAAPTQTPNKSTTSTGAHAESVVAHHLEQLGHTIIARNHKTKFYEIDIISTKNDKIYFTEVKYRQNTQHGTPLSAITSQKQKQMRYAAESFLKYTATSLNPILAAASVSGPDFHLDCWFPLAQ